MLLAIAIALDFEYIYFTEKPASQPLARSLAHSDSTLVAFCFQEYPVFVSETLQGHQQTNKKGPG